MDTTFQSNFVSKLRQLLPQNISLKDELAEILHVSSTSAYRRLSGETVISIDEALLICTHYKIPIANFAEDVPGLVNFKYLPPVNKKETFFKHLSMISSTVEELLGHDHRKIIYAAIDAPLFYQFGFDQLATFKMHFWMNAILGIDAFKKHYDENDIDRDYLTLTKNIYDNYLHIPSDELWPKNILTTTLTQIEYYWETGYFKSPEQALAILDQLTDLVTNAEQMAATQHKLKTGDTLQQQYAPFNLYQSDLLIGTNTILTIASEKKSAFISHLTFQTLTTQSNNYIHFTEQWLNRMISKSNPISGVSEKNRINFFRGLNEHIETMVRNIKDD